MNAGDYHFGVKAIDPLGKTTGLANLARRKSDATKHRTGQTENLFYPWSCIAFCFQVSLTTVPVGPTPAERKVRAHVSKY